MEELRTSHSKTQSIYPASRWGDESLSGDSLERKERSSKPRILLFIGGCLSVSLTLLLLLPGQKKVVGHKFARPPEMKVDDGISFDNQRVAQTILKTASGSILLQHYPFQMELIPKFEVFAGEFAQLHFEPNNPWYEGYHEQKVLATFNCHAFAIGSDIGLTPSDLLEAIPLQQFPNPLTTALTEFYNAVASVPVNMLAEDLQSMIGKIQPGDVVCLVNNSGTQREYIHMARIESVGKEIRFLSKMGRQGPVLLTNLQFLLRHYAKTNGVEIYRLKPSAS